MSGDIYFDKTAPFSTQLEQVLGHVDHAFLIDQGRFEYGLTSRNYFRVAADMLSLPDSTTPPSLAVSIDSDDGRKLLSDTREALMLPETATDSNIHTLLGRTATTLKELAVVGQEPETAWDLDLTKFIVWQLHGYVALSRFRESL